MARQYERLWLSIFAFLIVAVISGGAVLLFRDGGHSSGGEIVISTPTLQPRELEVHISGAVACPGIYSLGEDNSLEDVLQAAGGLSSAANGAEVSIYIPSGDEGLLDESQKVNVNTAEAWLLCALPGIGPGRSEAIMEYRAESGPFRCVEDLLKVPGIGSSTFEEVKDLVAVTGPR
jgi:competence protein ComEA